MAVGLRCTISFVVLYLEGGVHPGRSANQSVVSLIVKAYSVNAMHSTATKDAELSWPEWHRVKVKVK